MSELVGVGREKGAGEVRSDEMEVARMPPDAQPPLDEKEDMDLASTSRQPIELTRSLDEL
jgi:hypothetical protein